MANNELGFTPDSKITTRREYHTMRGEWFSAAIDGHPLVGTNGGVSLYRSRKDAKDAARDRLKGILEHGMLPAKLAPHLNQHGNN